jgi:uncharacterized membrane protein YgcG
MRTFRVGTGFSGLRLGKQSLLGALSLTLLLGTWPQGVAAQDPDPQASQQGTQQDQQQTAQDGSADQDAAAQAPQHTPQTADQLQQLVAPIALYPDSLVAQILAAATFPEQVVEADRFVQAHPDLKGDALAQAVDQQPWDPSVKALTAFPSVLGNMDKNLSWTSSLGDAYYNQEQDVMDAVQVMRQKAEQAGNLKSTPQQTVATQGSTVIIQPADPQVVYVPAYNPWGVYGYPVGPWPGWYPYPGIWYGGPYLSFGVGFGVGFFGGYGWGWNHWGGFDWHNHYVVYNHARYYSHSPTFYNRNSFYRGTAARGVYGNHAVAGHPALGAARPGGVYNHPGATPHPFSGDSRAARGYAPPRAQSATPHPNAVGGYNHGGETKSYSSRGSASFGGGHSGGGGGHGGGGHR